MQSDQPPGLETSNPNLCGGPWHYRRAPNGDTVFTSPGIQKPTDVYDPPGSTPPTPPRCITCDDVRLASDPNAKYSCLESSYNTYFTIADRRHAASARLKLLLAAAGDSLADAQRNTILRDHYGWHFGTYDGEPACESEPLPISDACLHPDPYPPTSLTWIGRLVACRSLGADHATPAAAAATFDDCLAIADFVDTIPDDPDPTCRNEWADAFADIVSSVAGRSIDTAPDDASLVESLRRADAIYAALELLSRGDMEWLRSRTGPILKHLLDATYAARYPYPPAPFGTNDADAARDFTLLAADEGRVADIGIIRAAFTAQPALESSPLLVGLLADALRATAQHADFLTEVHDVACRYRGCNSADSSPVVDFWRIIAALPSAPDLDLAIEAAGALEADSPELIEAFEAIAANHARLAAVLPFPGDGETPPEELPPGSAELLELIAKANRYVESFGQTGILVNGGEYPLLESLPHLEGDARDLLNERIGALRNELDDLDSNRIALVNALLERIQNGQEIDGLESQLEILRQRNDDIARRRDGLIARGRDQRESFAGVVSGFEAMRAAGTLSDQEAIDVVAFEALRLSGRDARFDGQHDGTNDGLLDIAAAPEGGPPWKAELRPGEQLRFNIANNWSPTCALHDASVLIRNNGTPWIIPETDRLNATTGPEGFTVTFGDQKLVARSARQPLETDPAILCPRIPEPQDPITRLDEHAFLYKECVEWTQQTDFDTSWVEAVSAQFETGVHLATTPFRDAPAGSLLAVLTPHDTPDTIVNVQVVHRDSVIVAPRPPDAALFSSYDVYLVVNDRRSTTCQPPPDALAINMNKIVPFGVAAQALGEGMATALRVMEAQAPQVIAQGVFPASDQTAMKSMAWATLQTEAGMDLNAVPAIRDLFTAWVNMQVASIDRRVQVADIDRNLAEMALQAQAIEQDLGAVHNQARLLTLVPRWTLHNLDQNALKADLRGIFLSLDADIPPLFALRHPVSLESFRGTQEYADEMVALMDTGFGDSVQVAADRLADFAEHVSQTVLSASNSNPVTSERIILAYPTPEQCAVGCTSSPLGRTEFGGLRVPSQEAIMAVWQSLRATRTATLSIGAPDAYESVGEASRLSCGDHGPVIRRMLLVGDLSGLTNPQWGALGYASDAFAAVENAYPTEVGTIVYRLPPFAEDIDLPLASIIDLDQLTGDAYPYLAEVGAGMSPVNDFSIELISLTNTEFNRIEALYLVMDVEKQTTAPDVYIPGVCELP